MLVFSGLVLTAALSSTAEAVLPAVTDGVARAVVVTARPPTPTASYAARELVEHIERATGVKLSVVEEGDIPIGFSTRIFLGDTQAARAAGIDVDALAPDAFVLKVADGSVYVAGAESAEADPLDLGSDLQPNRHGGPLFGVYEVLERSLGVRWLWPGESGVHVPPRDQVWIDAGDEVISPRFVFRQYRCDHLLRSARKWPRVDEVTRVLSGYSQEGIERVARELLVFLRRHRLGFSEVVVRGGHRVAGVSWAEHGQAHPEWFGMDGEGRRGFGEPPDSRKVPFCVSDPELHRRIVEQGWDGGPWLALGEMDTARYCQCPACLAWDAPQECQPGDEKYIVSDRYARFWQTIASAAARRRPDVRVAVLVYLHYFPAPLQNIALNGNIYGQFCPWGSLAGGWEEREAHWLGWRRAGMRLAWRPNDWCHGYVMPLPGSVHGGAGKFFRFAARHDMYAFDYDYLQAHWVTRNPMLYLHMRWASRPDLTVEQGLAEFCAAFGPAVELLREYVDYWENYAYPPGTGRLNYMAMGDVSATFPASAFADASAILNRALTAARAASEPVYAQRVEFLLAGMRHAALTAAFWSTLDPPPRGERGWRVPEQEDRRAAAANALRRLLECRRASQHWPVADFWSAASNEKRNIPGIGVLLGGE